MITALGAVVTVNAQEDKSKDKSLNREMTLEREYTPTVQDANKVNTLPLVKEPEAKKVPISYSNFSIAATPEKEFSLLPSGSIMMRNYYELKLRDLTEAETGVKNDIPVTFSENFYWDRAFSLNWAITNSVNIHFTSGTNARIDAPYVQVNKKLDPDSYKLWKDSIKQSIADLGTPLKYDQTFTVTWQLPTQFIPILDWTNNSINYNATYNWDRGATSTNSDIEIGNTIKNQRQFQIQSNLNFISLYNKFNFLKKINQKVGNLNTANANSRNDNNNQPRKLEKKKFEKEITLSKDSGTIVRHSMA